MGDSAVTAAVPAPAPWGSRLLGTAEERSGIRRIRIQVLLTASLVFANSFGIAMTMVFVGFVLPGPPLFTRELMVLNFVVFPLCAIVAVVIGVVWGTVWCLRTLRWALVPDRVPTVAEQVAATAVPRHLVIVQATLWLAALALMTPARTRTDPGTLRPACRSRCGGAGIGERLGIGRRGM